jgi:hypothetical protein
MVAGDTYYRTEPYELKLKHVIYIIPTGTENQALPHGQGYETYLY